MKKVTEIYNDNRTTVSSIEACLKHAAKSRNLYLGTSHRIFHARQTLFSAGDPFEGIYILRSGSVKSYISRLNGEEHITKFYFPGDLLGLDGFDDYVHIQNLLFLETSSVCFISQSVLNNLIKNSDTFRHHLLKAMSHLSMADSSMMMCLSTCSSEQKFARFILELSEQFASNGLSGKDFRLSMTRTDIANYLGLALETVSRVLANFQLQQIITVHNRQLSILDFEALKHYDSRVTFHSK